MPSQRACILLKEIFTMRNWQNSLMYVVSGKQGVKSCREMKAETVSQSLQIIYIYKLLASFPGCIPLFLAIRNLFFLTLFIASVWHGTPDADYACIFTLPTLCNPLDKASPYHLEKDQVMVYLYFAFSEMVIIIQQNLPYVI